MNLKNLYLTEEQLEDPAFQKVNLACGRRLYPGEGWTNLDLEERQNVEYCNIWNLKWPVEAGSVDYMLTSHILEHVPHHHPGFDGEYWYHFFTYLLSRLSDDALLEVWGPDPEKRNTLEYVGHTRLIGPSSFSEYTQAHTVFSSLENQASRRHYHMELVHMKRRRGIHLGLIDDYHFNKYLGEGWRDRFSTVLGRKDEIRMVFKVTQEDGK